MDALDLARQKLKAVRTQAQNTDTQREISEISEKRQSAQPCTPLTVAAAEYDRLGKQIDALADQATAARARGDTAEGERLGSEVRALVVGPYLQARERFAAMLGSGSGAHS